MINRKYISLLAECPDTYVLYNEYCYGFFVNKTQKLSYSHAKRRCSANPKYALTSALTTEETEYLGNTTVKTNPNIGIKSYNFPWIGLHKDAFASDGIE